MIQDVTEILNKNWKSWFGSEAPDQFHFMKIMGDAPHKEEVNFLVFAGNERTPRILARLSQTAAQQQEYELLRQQSSQDGESPDRQRTLWLAPLANGWSLYIFSIPSGSPINTAKGPWIASSWPSSHD